MPAQARQSLGSVPAEKRKVKHRKKPRAKSAMTVYNDQLVAAGKPDGTPFKKKRPNPRLNRGPNGEVLYKAEKVKAWQDRFIRSLRATHHIGKAVIAAGVTRNWAYANKASDPAFRQRWLNAWDAGIDDLEEEAHRRAMEGSDILLIFMLKGNRGEKYRDRVIAENADGTPLSFTLNIARAKDSEDPAEQSPPQEEEDVYDVPKEDVRQLSEAED